MWEFLKDQLRYENDPNCVNFITTLVGMIVGIIVYAAGLAAFLLTAWVIICFLMRLC